MEVEPIEGIGCVPLGETDWALFGLSLPDSLENFPQARAKLHGLGVGRLF